MINLYIINIKEIAAHKEEVLSLVDEDRRKKALAYRNEDDVLRSLGVGYLYTKILGKTPLFDAKGRPFYEEGPYISLSHSGSYCLMGVSELPLGVDVQIIGDFPEKLKKFFPFYYESDKEFYIDWCLYEALSKCIGIGIALPMDNIFPLKRRYRYEGKEYSLDCHIHDGHVIAIAAEGQWREITTSYLTFS